MTTNHTKLILERNEDKENAIAYTFRDVQVVRDIIMSFFFFFYFMNALKNLVFVFFSAIIWILCLSILSDRTTFFLVDFRVKFCSRSFVSNTVMDRFKKYLKYLKYDLVFG